MNTLKRALMAGVCRAACEGSTVCQVAEGQLQSMKRKAAASQKHLTS